MNQRNDETAKCFQAFESVDAKANYSETGQPSCSNKSDSIEVLNDYCLQYIYKKLYPRDQISLSQTCRRFSDVFITLSRLQFKRLRLSLIDYLELVEQLRFFKKVGPYIESIEGKFMCKDSKYAMEFIARYCTNIKGIVTDDERFLHNLIKRIENLKHTNYELITGNHICDLRNIEVFSVEGCCCQHALNPAIFKEICLNLSNLHTLDTSYCLLADATYFDNIVQHLPKLEDLKIRNTKAQYECIAQLPKLKRLTIYNLNDTTPLRHGLLIELVKHKSEQLEELMLMGRNSFNFEGASLIGDLKKLKKLSCHNNRTLDDMYLEKFAQLTNLEDINVGYCSYISDLGLLNLLKKCPKLKRINFMHCLRITDKFIYDAVELLKEHAYTVQRKVPVILLASKPIKADKFTSSKYLVKVLTDYMFNYDEEDICFGSF